MGKWSNIPMAGVGGICVNTSVPVGEMQRNGYTSAPDRTNRESEYFRVVRRQIGAQNGRDFEKIDQPPTQKREIQSGFFSRKRTPIG